jgi:hypothetical protein
MSPRGEGLLTRQIRTQSRGEKKPKTRNKPSPNGVKLYRTPSKSPKKATHQSGLIWARLGCGRTPGTLAPFLARLGPSFGMAVHLMH